ncbi:helix-turn-helix transcriptional regulator [Paractinoplanes rishiriensis]|uniref:LuxR family transcriptional regulator n=1 Tax=Paractinoplanes rishiriensis TaxID=1050105 RepID=A0A919KBM8_9ACTN|nr:LuxR family transcriptional regulator [Actinoplanes rishiriensis]GIF02425.1 LuxR family transcriptional regulator [Actinoplanes rishiriensis]
MTLAGRAEDSAAVLACIGDAVGGRASTLLVRGEAGVGKTSLVGETCRAASDRVETIWAGCLPLTSMTVPLLPLRGVLRLAGLGDGVTVVEFDAWLDRSTADRPVVLVVDDLQWADQSSLDVLLYVIAGRQDRGLALIVTLRAGAENERLSGWLADVQRLPRVRELILDRLDRAGTGEQIAGIFGRPPDEGLVDEVHVRTGGNPYLTSLLVRDVDPRATVLPASRPVRLRDAVIRPWREMSPQARELTRIVAVGGHPQSYDRLVRIALTLGFGAPVLPVLREAVEAGVMRATLEGRYWFTHPLLAEILDGDLLPEQRRQMHASYASALHDDPTDIADLADHYERAGMTEPAFRWALQAADATAGAAERLRLFRRALSLWPNLKNPKISRTDLWEQIRAAAAQAGLGPEDLEAVEALIELLPPDREPLRLGRLMVRRAVLRMSMGIDGPNVELRRAAVAVTAPYPGSVEHALATGRLAEAMLFAGDPDGVPLAGTALELAEACGDEEALPAALIPTAYAKLRTGRPGAEQDATRAWKIASRLRLFTTFKDAVYATVNVHHNASPSYAAAIYRRGAEDLAARGAPHSHIAEMCAWEATQLLRMGDWPECRRRLRVALGARPGPRGDAVARLTAAELACLQGRQAEAEGHLARAEEIFAVHASGLSFLRFNEVRAQMAFGAGNPERAYEIAVRDLDCGRYVEEMLPIAARALADQADACRDNGRDPARVLAALADLRRRYPIVVPDPGAVLPDDEQRAMQAGADAETARAARDPAELVLWRAAADACYEAGLPWEEAYTRWRQAQAALRDRRTHREAPEALRRAQQLATDLAAQPLLTDLQKLARSARINPTETARPVEPTSDLPGLTRREREILGYLLAGGTYAEIAKALVLSEKTISVHISNMLRKTGTANRVQLAELARRRREERPRHDGSDIR